MNKYTKKTLEYSENQIFKPLFSKKGRSYPFLNLRSF